QTVWTKKGPLFTATKSGAERKADERSVGCAIARRATPSGSSYDSWYPKGVTLNVSAFRGGCEAFSRAGLGRLVTSVRGSSRSHKATKKGACESHRSAKPGNLRSNIRRFLGGCCYFFHWYMDVTGQVSAYGQA